nr:MAG TPA: hypothetical protein [Caudoviricetes sp.]
MICNITLMYSDKDNRYIAFQPFDETDMYLKNGLVDSLNMLYELFSPNLSSEDKIHVSTYIYDVFRLSDYVITNKGWKINID